MHPKGAALCELHENTKGRVPNNMTEICDVNSKDYVMCNGRGSLEEHDEQAISKRQRGEENEDECKIVKARCVILVNMNAKSYDFKCQKEEMW